MILKTKAWRRWLMLGACSLLCAGNGAVGIRAEELKLEARLIWASNEPTSPNPKHKKLDSALTKWLSEKYNWKHYFEENQQTVTLRDREPEKVPMSPTCRLEITHLGKSRIEVKLYGKDKPDGKDKLVNRVEHTLPKNDRLVIAGDSQNKTAWFIALKTVEPK